MNATKLKKYREDLHSIPEIGFAEHYTKQYLHAAMQNCGAIIHEVGQTGLVLYFDNGRQSTIAFRSDIDALKISEKTEVDFASKHPGFMHACGHDGHMAMLLGLCDYISENRRQIKHNVVLIFQPSEEANAGANSIVSSGILQKYQVQAIFGFHVWPGLPQGKVFSKAGPLMASAIQTQITIHGKSAHVASSEQGIDSLEIATDLLSGIYAFDRKIGDDFLHLIKFGTMQSGTAHNILADKTVISGSIRSYSAKDNLYIKDSLRQIADKCLSSFSRRNNISSLDANIDFSFSDEVAIAYPAVVNDENLFTKVCACADDTVNVLEKPVLQAEDFSIYGEVAPYVFSFLGVGTDKPPLHSDTFIFDSVILEKGLEFYKKLLEVEL